MYTFTDIYKLFDGENLKESPELFFALSQSEELRNYFQDAVKFKTAAAKIPVPQPDSALKNELFRKIGIINQPAQKSFIFGNIAKHLMTSLITAVVTILLMLNLNRSGEMVTSKNVSVKKSVENNLQFSKQAVTPEIIEEKKFKPAERQNSDKIIYIANKSETENTIDISNSDDIINNNINNETLTDKNDENLIEQKSEVQIIKNENFQLPEIVNISESNSGKKSPVFLQFRILSDRHSDKPTIPPAVFQDFNNTSLGIYYQVLEWFITGIDYRRENFFQRYRGRDSNGILNEYDQQPNFNTFSADIVLMPFEFWNIKPLADLAAGVNSAGYVLRGGLGLEYYLRPDVGLNFGAEYSKLYYHHQKNNFESEKASFLIGIKYNF